MRRDSKQLHVWKLQLQIYKIDAVTFLEASWYWSKGCVPEASTWSIRECVRAGACKDYGDVRNVMLACTLLVIRAMLVTVLNDARHVVFIRCHNWYTKSEPAVHISNQIVLKRVGTQSNCTCKFTWLMLSNFSKRLGTGVTAAFLKPVLDKYVNAYVSVLAKIMETLKT